MSGAQGHYRKNGRNRNTGMNAARVLVIQQLNPGETADLHEEIAERAAKNRLLEKLTDARAIALSEQMLDLFADLEEFTSSCIRERISKVFDRALHSLRLDHIKADPVIQDARAKTENALRQVFESVSQAA